MGRISTTNIITPFLSLRFACRISVATTAFLQIPACFASCTMLQEEENPIIIKLSGAGAASALDIFVFDAKEPFLLDSYQQSVGEDCAFVLSGPGEKIVAAIAAKPGDKLSRASVSRLQDLNREVFRLENDSPESSLRYGCALVGPGASKSIVLNLYPLICSIRVRSVSCDFSGRPYGVPVFHNDNLFLLNAVSESCPMAAEGGRPVSWMNYGFPDREHPFIYTKGFGDVGPDRIYPMSTLYCYPNPASKPPTRLVLEGHVGDVHCYYPINVPLVRGGMSYELDITLHRMGTDSPDCAASPGTITVEYSTVPWYESEETEEIY